MRGLRTLTWVELNLFVCEPLTMVFTLALPVIFLFVLGGVFGNTADEGIFRGVGPMNYYVPAYIGLVACSVGVVSLPVHLAVYRERGVLRRFRAPPLSVWAVLGSHVIVSLIIGVVGTILLVAVAVAAYDVALPVSPALILGAFGLGTLSFAALGLLLGALLPTARAAPGVGLILFSSCSCWAGPVPHPRCSPRPLALSATSLPCAMSSSRSRTPSLAWAGT